MPLIYLRQPVGTSVLSWGTASEFPIEQGGTVLLLFWDKLFPFTSFSDVHNLIIIYLFVFLNQ